jgi:hypothetical protein
LAKKSLFTVLQEEINIRERSEGISPADILELPPTLRTLLNIITRKGEASLIELAKAAKHDKDEVAQALSILADKGYLREIGEGDDRHYKTYLGRTRKRQVPLNIWEGLDDKVQ